MNKAGSLLAFLCRSSTTQYQVQSSTTQSFWRLKSFFSKVYRQHSPTIMNLTISHVRKVSDDMTEILQIPPGALKGKKKDVALRRRTRIAAASHRSSTTTAKNDEMQQMWKRGG
jgi:hypothetical protein